MAQQTTLKAIGLFTFFNNIGEIPEGGLVEADNVVIDRNGVIEQRRGFKTIGSAAADDIKQLLVYKGRLIQHLENGTLNYDISDNGSFSTSLGTVSAPVITTSDGVNRTYRIKGLEENGNFYLASNDGVKKISASSSSNVVASSVGDAGGLRALDCDAADGGAGTAIANNNVYVSYRVTWAVTDNNGNFVEGSPSGAFTYNNTSGAGRNVYVYTTLPATSTFSSKIPSAYYRLRVYRTKATASSSTGDEMQLAFESFYSALDITTYAASGKVRVLDETPESLLGEFLYTSPNSGEGINQANDVPPACKDIASFKNSLFCANTRKKHFISLSFDGVGTLVSGTSKFYISDGTNTFTYLYQAGVSLDGFDGDATAATPTFSGTTVDAVARSLVRVINQDDTASKFFNAYYDFSAGAVPGSFTIERKDFTDTAFFVYVDASASTGVAFDPNLSSGTAIATATAASGTVTVSTAPNAHNLSVGQRVLIHSTTGGTNINGAFTVLTVPSTTSFTYASAGAVSATAATGRVVTEMSDNEKAPNRLYYSKYQQPDAIPAVNYFSVGAKDRAILRVLALRDSLLIFKEEGIYRVSGDVETFNLALMDSSANLIAPDTAAVLNNQVYMLSEQGVVTVSDTGVSVISRPIEDQFNKLSSSAYTNFATASFGIGYELDRSYLIFVPTETSDSIASQVFRFNTFTTSWTRWILTKAAAAIKSNKLYLAASDAYVEEERKSFSRQDYADREASDSIGDGLLEDNLLTLTSVSSIDIGDAVVQTQYLTIAYFNRVLRKLDMDVLVPSTNYYSTLQASAGDNLRDKLLALATKIDTDLGYVGTYLSLITGTSDPTNASYFTDLQTDFNDITAQLNGDANVFFTNYPTSSGTVSLEALIDDINVPFQRLTLKSTLPLIVGPVTRKKRIYTSVTWAPQSFGDPSVLKQVREGTIIFDKDNFTDAFVSYSSDLQPNFEEIAFDGSGNGVWGQFGWGSAAWGGDGTSRPFRTYIPRQKQRCRYLKAKFNHINALEKFAIQGISYFFDGTSSRAYR